MEIIVVTGTPGTGKTIISKKLAKMLNLYYIDVNDFIARNKLYEGYDKKRKTKIVDVKKLNKKLIEEIKKIKLLKRYINDNALLLKVRGKRHVNKIKTLIKKSSNEKFNKRIIQQLITTNKNMIKNIKEINGIIIDSHLSHYLPRKYVDLCIVTKCDIKVLNKRLKNKKFYKNKIKENLQAEIFDICHNEALERKHNVLIINTTKGFNISEVVKRMGG